VVAVLVILDGASEPLRAGEPTILVLARTPALDRLAREGELARVRVRRPARRLTERAVAALPERALPAHRATAGAGAAA
jgi:hypothetical protein